MPVHRHRILDSIERLPEILRPPRVMTLQWIGEVLHNYEHRYEYYRKVIGEMAGFYNAHGLKMMVLKGYACSLNWPKPEHRPCGDIDLFLDEPNYQKAKRFLTPLATSVEEEQVDKLHFSMYIDDWQVELHGTLHSNLGKRFDRVLDAMQDAAFFDGKVRQWMDGKTPVFLPAADEDAVFVFSHILQHFFRGGIGLRQICDWCRLLWTYRADIDQELLDMRLKEMDTMAEWKAFAALAVNTLGMPADAMPFYSQNRRWARKADKILAFVLETGNFGHNRDNSYYKTSPYLVRKAISLWRHTKDGLRQFTIFPKHSLIAWGQMLKEGVKAVGRGK